MARKIVITSGKGGVGKTTICANIGITLARYGFKVLMVDADFGLNNLDVVMGLENKVKYNISDVIASKCRIKQALVQDEKFPTLFILPSGNLETLKDISTDEMNEIINSISPSFDYILIDCPAGVDMSFHRAVFPANEAIVVVTPSISSIRDADKVISILSNYNLNSTSLVINRVRGDMLLSGEIISVEKISELLKCNILGVIPDDDSFLSSSQTQRFSLGTCESRAFTLLIENLNNGSKKIYDCTYKYRGVMGIIRRNLRRKI